MILSEKLYLCICEQAYVITEVIGAHGAPGLLLG